MSNRLGGKQGTAYLGTNANQPPNVHFADRPPNQYDTQNVSLNDFWFDSSANGLARFWLLASLQGNNTSKGSLGDWVQLDSGSTLTLTSNSGGPVAPSSGNINLIGNSTTITGVGNPGTSTITFSTTGIVATQYDGDTGVAVPSAGILKIVTIGSGLKNCGGSVDTFGSGNTILLTMTDASGNTFIGNASGSGDASLAGINNTGLGEGSLTSLLFGSFNTGLGYQALNNLAGSASDNIAVGYQAGTNYISTESSNIVIGNTGTVSESHVMRLGTNGSGLGQQNACYVGGIYGASFDFSTEQLVMIDSTNKLGSTDLSADSWTPTLSFGGSSTGITYSVQEGIYQSIGNLVFYAGGFVLTSKGAQTGTARVNGLPFNASGVFNVQFGQLAVANITFAMGQTYAWNLNEVGTSNLFLSTGGSGNPQLLLDDTSFANNSSISVTGFYFRN